MLKKVACFMTILFCFLVCMTQKNAKFHEYRFYTVPVGSRMVGWGGGVNYKGVLPTGTKTYISTD